MTNQTFVAEHLRRRVAWRRLSASSLAATRPSVTRRIIAPVTNTRDAFTIVELLVVIAIIGVLVSILLPAVNAVRENARRTQNLNNMKQIGVAVMAYEEANKTYPPLVKYPRGVPATAENMNRTVSWAFELLPFLEQQNVYDTYDSTEPVTDPVNSVAMGTPVPTFANPRRRDATATSRFMSEPSRFGALLDYAANGGVIVDQNQQPVKLPNDPQQITQDYPYRERFDPRHSGPFHISLAVPQAAVKDGLGNTLCVGDRWKGPNLMGSRMGWNDLAGFAGESLPTTVRYANPDTSSTLGLQFPIGITDTSLVKFGSDRGSDACFVFLDGHALWLSYETDPIVYMSLASINDGRPVPPL